MCNTSNKKNHKIPKNSYFSLEKTNFPSVPFLLKININADPALSYQQLDVLINLTGSRSLLLIGNADSRGQ